MSHIEVKGQIIFIDGSCDICTLFNAFIYLMCFVWQLEEVIETLKPKGLLKGVRHILDMEKDDWITRDDVSRGLDTLGKHGISYDLLVR